MTKRGRKNSRHKRKVKNLLEKRVREYVRENLKTRAVFVEPGLGGTVGAGDAMVMLGDTGQACWLEFKASSSWEIRAKQMKFAVLCDMYGFPYFLLFNDIGGILKWQIDGAKNPDKEHNKNNVDNPFVLIKLLWEEVKNMPPIRKYQFKPKFVFLKRLSKQDDLEKELLGEIT